jgi:hypothetical protein
LLAVAGSPLQTSNLILVIRPADEHLAGVSTYCVLPPNPACFSIPLGALPQDKPHQRDSVKYDETSLNLFG